MPLFRRRKVCCFYCGQHSIPDSSAAYHPNGRVSCFICPHCNADNHLDPKGEIVDYVPETTKAPLIYAHRRPSHTPLSRPTAIDSITSCENSSTPEPTFCRTCQHNQIIVQNAKSDYPMPPEDHPDYDLHNDVLYPNFVKDLENRWPQVCIECGPKVKKRLKKVNYDAKVASLGHMLARSEQPNTTSSHGFHPLRALKWAVWVVRGVVWVWANLLFLVWHGSAILHPSGSNSMEEPEWKQCFVASWSKSELDATCYDVSRRQASNYFIYTLFGFWWLYRQWGVEMHPEKKLVGAGEYLKLEISAVIIRFLGLILLGEHGWLQASEETTVIMHVGFFFISIIATLFSITCLKLEDPPTFSLRETLPPSPIKQPAVPVKPQPRANSPSLSVHPPRKQSPPQQSPNKPPQQLSLAKTPPLRPLYSNQPIPPITPSYRESNAGTIRSPSPSPAHGQDDDAMDWDPVSPTPCNKSNPWPSNGPPSPSPFITATPALPPVGNAFANFHPMRQPTSRLFSDMTTSPKKPSPPRPWGQQSISTDKDGGSSFRLKDRYFPMAQPKFLPPDQDTGLETIFDGGLKLVDDLPVLELESESLFETLCRLALLVIAAGVVVPLSSTSLHSPLSISSPLQPYICIILVIIASLWRAYRSQYMARTVSVVLAAVAIAIAVVPSHARTAEACVVAVGGLRETWALLKRMQRQRKRAFWMDEQKKAEGTDSGTSGAENEVSARSKAQTPVDAFGFRVKGSARSGVSSGIGIGIGRGQGGVVGRVTTRSVTEKDQGRRSGSGTGLRLSPMNELEF